MPEIPEIGPEEARRRLESEEGHIYLDVRTVPEFVAGHAPGAVNIPIAEVNPRTGQMELNQTFLSIVRTHIPCDAQLIVGCKSGGRSARAAQVLLEVGYKYVVNLAGGFGGAADMTGQVICEGWATLGYPIERGPGDDKSYDALKEAAQE